MQPANRLSSTLRTGLWGALLLAAPLLTAADAPPAPAKKAAPAGLGGLFTPPTSGAQEVQISSDSMDMNLGEHTASFTGNVLVRDPRYQIRSDKMIVRFSVDQQLERIEAVGNVQIDELTAKRRAVAGRADYDVIKGTFVLTDKPALSMGGDSMQNASKITYFRDNERVIFERGDDNQRPTLRFTPKTGDSIGLPGRAKDTASAAAGAAASGATENGKTESGKTAP
ncbi:MAG: LptA/OstA family protein [Lentisphaeria bacterium]